MKTLIIILLIVCMIFLIFCLVGMQEKVTDQNRSEGSIRKGLEEKESGVVGQIVRHGNFASRYVDPRHVEVWLPASYNDAPEKQYSVIYMHDGQNLFDPATSFIGVDWGIDESMTRLAAEKKAPEAIIVGIWNTPKRKPEYMPQKAFALWTNEPGRASFITEMGSVPISDAYLKFIVEELKPFIDRTYRTLPGPEHTSIMGSSLGGLISLYAVCEYPHVFGGAGCVSTHWPIGEGVMIEYMKTALPAPQSHKIYFDFGTETMDAQYEPYQVKADSLMAAVGYRKNQNWITQKFPGDDHSERAWRKRVHIPIIFLLTGQVPVVVD